MSRLRTIKPEFWSDPIIISCSRDARLLFVGMWNFADDYGNIEANSLQIKCLVYPADNINIDPLLAELEDPKKKLIIKYKVDGREFYHIRTFLTHQRIDHPSKPRCPSFDSQAIVAPEAQDGELFDEPLKQFKQSKKSPSFNPNFKRYFEEFWEIYPLKLGKKRAHRHFDAQIKTSKDLENLHFALEIYLKHLKKNQWKKPQQGNTFINNHTDWLEFEEPKKLSETDQRLKEAYERRKK